VFVFFFNDVELCVCSFSVFLRLLPPPSLSPPIMIPICLCGEDWSCYCSSICCWFSLHFFVPIVKLIKECPPPCLFSKNQTPLLLAVIHVFLFLFSVSHGCPNSFPLNPLVHLVPLPPQQQLPFCNILPLSPAC